MNAGSRVGALAAGTVVILAVTACAADTSSMSTPIDSADSPPASTESPASTMHNDADVMFVQQMIVHHQGAVAMAELAPGRADSADVKALAERIKAAQELEIEQMTSWLLAWGGAATAAESSAMSRMGGLDPDSTGNDGSGGPMPGMIPDGQMQQLIEASGADFDPMFIEMMIAHHEDAIAMSQIQMDIGHNPDPLALADTITRTQTAEIAEMKALLLGK